MYVYTDHHLSFVVVKVFVKQFYHFPGKGSATAFSSYSSLTVACVGVGAVVSTLSVRLLNLNLTCTEVILIVGIEDRQGLSREIKLLYY